jgi:hypothetical protein
MDPALMSRLSSKEFGFFDRLDVLFIDDASLLDRRQLYILRWLQERHKTTNMQIVCAGDFRQLPAIIKPHHVVASPRLYREPLFRTTIWDSFKMTISCLTENFRHRVDPTYMELLERLGLGLLLESDFAALSSRCIEPLLTDGVRPTHILSSSSMIDKIKVDHLLELCGATNDEAISTLHEMVLKWVYSKSLDVPLSAHDQSIFDRLKLFRPFVFYTTYLNTTGVFLLQDECVRVYSEDLDATLDANLMTIGGLWKPLSQHARVARFAVSKCPIQVQLFMEGAQVVLVTNFHASEGLVYGARGVIVGFKEAPMKLLKDIPDMDGDKSLMQEPLLSSVLCPIVRFATTGYEVMIPPCQYDWCYDRRRRLYVTIVGIPLALATHLTVYNIQGMTLTRACLDLQHFQQGHNLYAALSKVHSLQDLYLSNMSQLIVNGDKDVIDYYMQHTPGYRDRFGALLERAGLWNVRRAMSVIDEDEET